jgi:hypothetical protein
MGRGNCSRDSRSSAAAILGGAGCLGYALQRNDGMGDPQAFAWLTAALGFATRSARSLLHGAVKARAMVWQRALPNGLPGSPAPLFKEFRSAVEAAAMKLRPALSGIAPAAALAPVESLR